MRREDSKRYNCAIRAFHVCHVPMHLVDTHGICDLRPRKLPRIVNLLIRATHGLLRIHDLSVCVCVCVCVCVYVSATPSSTSPLTGYQSC